jgi:hypothetical protein
MVWGTDRHSSAHTTDGPSRLDGSLIGASLSDAERDSSGACLAEIRHAEWEGFIVNRSGDAADPATELAGSPN